MSLVAAPRERARDPARNRALLPALSDLPGRPAPPGPGIQGPSGQGAPNARDSVEDRTRPVGGPPGGEEPLRPFSASVPDRSCLPRPPPRRCRPRPPPAPPPSSRSGSPPPPPAPPRPRRRQRDRARFYHLPDTPATVTTNAPQPRLSGEPLPAIEEPTRPPYSPLLVAGLFSPPGPPACSKLPGLSRPTCALLHPLINPPLPVIGGSPLGRPVRSPSRFFESFLFHVS